MPGGRDPNIFITRWNDSEALKKCEVEIHSFKCGHENHHLYRCNDHAGKLEVDVPGYAYCEGTLAPHEDVTRAVSNENCPEHADRAKKAYDEAKAEERKADDDDSRDREAEQDDDDYEEIRYEGLLSSTGYA